MRKLLSILAAVLITATVWAQSPQKMSYQAVIRDAGNKLITSHSVGMRISILKGSASGTAVYTETQTPTTNANGLVSIEFGGGAGFDAINWANGIYFFKTETDPTGGTNYTISGTSQLLSVPLALHAKSSNFTYSVSSTRDILNFGNGQQIFIPGISAANPGSDAYILNLTATNGTVVKNPDMATYNNESTVQLTATPNSGYKFTSWSGDATGTRNPLPVFMDANKNINANFTATAANTFTLNVTATNGSFLKNPDLAAYKSGAIVQLTAMPNSGYRFTSWSGDATGSKNPLAVSMNANKNIVANFTQGDTKTLQALIDSCPTNGTVSIPAGTYYIDAQISLKLKNNMTLQMESGTILIAIPNNTTNNTYIIKIEGISNVNVIGGTVQGERNGHIGTIGEGGMGIGINGSTNVKITNVISKDNWGDGLFVGYGSKIITIDSVTSDNNRRQGMSISWADSVVVKNSIFKNTNGTSPMAGLDIEPDVTGAVINNIWILNSQFLNNNANGIIVANYSNANTNDFIDGNTFTGNGGGGAIRVIMGTSANNYRFTNNTIVHQTAGFVLNSGSTGNTITGNTVTAPILIVGDDGGNTVSGNTLH